MVMRLQSLCCVLQPFLVVQKGLRAEDDIQTPKTSIFSSKELLKCHFLPPCVATTIETHVVAVAVAVDTAVDASLAMALPAVAGGHFLQKMLFILLLEHN